MRILPKEEGCINREEMNILVNASSLGAVLEDVCGLRPANNAWHINLTELDAMVKGINLQWQAKRLHLHTKPFVFTTGCPTCWLEKQE